MSQLMNVLVPNFTSKSQVSAWIDPNATHGLWMQLRLGCGGSSGVDFRYLLYLNLAIATAAGVPVPIFPVPEPIPPQPAPAGPNATALQRATAENLFNAWFKRKTNSVEDQKELNRLNGYQDIIKQSLLKGIDNCPFLKGFLRNPINNFTVHQILTDFFTAEVLAINNTDRNDVYAKLSEPFYFEVNNNINAVSQLTQALFNDTEFITFIGTSAQPFAQTELFNMFMAKYGKNIYFQNGLQRQLETNPNSTKADVEAIARNIAQVMDHQNGWRLVKQQYVNKTMYANHSSLSQAPPLAPDTDDDDDDSSVAIAAVKKSKNFIQKKKSDKPVFSDTELFEFAVKAKNSPHLPCPMHPNASPSHKAKDCKVIKATSKKLKDMLG